MNRLFYGDNLEVLRKHIADESVDLVYLDPPFPRKLACWGLGCGRDFERGTGDVEAGQVAA
jgi:hypothetical protein